MASLRDIFVPSAFRTHASDAVRDSELGGAAPAVAVEIFEVTDLLIPAGTDWSAVPHEIGRFTLQSHQFLTDGGSYLEIDSPIADIQLHLGAGYENDPPDLMNADVDLFASTLLGAGDGKVVSRGSSLDNPVVFVGAAPREVIAVLYTNAPTTADVTVVRARTAFFVI